MISSKCIKGLTHYLGDKQDFNASSEGPSSGISDHIKENKLRNYHK